MNARGRGREPFRGKPRQDDTHPYDRRDGTGKGNRGDKKEGAGQGNWGTKNEVVYKKKDADTVEAEEGKTTEELKAAEPVEEKEKFIEEVIGVSYEDYFKDKKKTTKLEARTAEVAPKQFEGQKLETSTAVKEH